MFRRLYRWLKATAVRRRIEREADAELQFHLDMEIESHRAAGLPAEEARRLAMRDLGGLTQTREDIREVRRTWMDGLWQDVRYALRLLGRQPTFTAGALATLTLGIGASAAIASATYAIMWRPLPVNDERTLVVGYVTNQTSGAPGALDYQLFQAWQASGLFQGLAAVTHERRDLLGEVTEPIQVQLVTNNFFEVTGIRPVLGRVFSDADRSASEIPAVVSDGFWRSRFTGQPGEQNATLALGSDVVRIIGVLSRGADRWRRGVTQIWLPLERTAEPRTLKRGYWIFTPIGRTASQRLLADADRLGALENPGPNSPRFTKGAQLIPLRKDITPERVSRLMLVLLASVALTLIVVCANLSNLLLARGPGRAAELTVRLAMGAGRARIVRQLLVETAVLAIPGGIFGTLLAWWAVSLFAAAQPVSILAAFDVRATSALAWCGVIASSLSALACGVMPAFSAARATLARGVASLEIVRTARVWSRALVAIEVAAGLVVLVSAVLLMKSLAHIGAVDLGFQPERVFMFQARLPAAAPGTDAATRSARYGVLQHDVISRLGAVPGVEIATIGSELFIPGPAGRSSIVFDDGRRLLNGSPKDFPLVPGVRLAGPDYFRVHGIELRRGREFTASDDLSAPRVVLINQEMARMHFPGTEPIGRRMNLGSRTGADTFSEPWSEIVGVVGNVRHSGGDVAIRPEVYVSALQVPRQNFTVMLKTAVSSQAVAPLAQAALKQVDPAIAVYATRSLDDVVGSATADVRYTSAMLTAFALLTVILSAIGIYSVLAYAIAARQRDLAIRTALGAEPSSLARGVVKQAAWMVLPGVAGGVALAVFATRALNLLLFEVAPNDPGAFAGAIVGVTLVALAAASIPARRATRVNVVAALKS